MDQKEWDDACRLVQADDQLPIREVGSWSEDKLFLWHKYVQLTTSAMGRRWRSGLAYADLFAGPGVCRIREKSRRVPGSPLIAALAPIPFQKLVFVESDEAAAEALGARLARTEVARRCNVLRGDCNEMIDDVVALLPPDALTLAFIDPEGLDVAWKTIEKLASHGKVDMLNLFADAYDALRNLQPLLEGRDLRLDQMMGDSDWKDRARSLPNWHPNNLREFFSKEFIQRLKDRLGYRAADTKIIEGPSGPLYRLIYVSKHERGVEFWRKVDYRDRGGQASLFRS